MHRVSPKELSNIHGNGNFIICGDLNFDFEPCYRNKRDRLVWRDPDCKNAEFYGIMRTDADQDEYHCTLAMDGRLHCMNLTTEDGGYFDLSAKRVLPLIQAGDGQ